MRPDCPHAWCRIHVPRGWLRSFRRHWPLYLALVAGLTLVVARFVEIRQLAIALTEGRWQWMLTATLLQGVYYALYAEEYRCGFATVGVASQAWALLPVLLASMFVGTVTPAGTLSSAAVLVDDAARRKQSAARAAEGILLVWVAGLTSALPMLAIGLTYLRGRGALPVFAVIASLVFLGYSGLLVGVLLAAAWQPARLRAILDWVQQRVNGLMVRLRRPPALNEGWAERNAAEAGGAAQAVMGRPRQVGRTLMAGLGTHLVNLACLYALFLSFRNPMHLGALAAAYALGFVSSVISFIPFDLGIVAGVMTLVYASLGVPTAKAALIALTFRGLNVYLPIAVGFFAFRRLFPPSGD